MGDRDDGTKLFVGNITFQTRASELEELFAAYGKVIECRIAEDQGRPKGFAFITMENADDAEEAMRKLTGTQVDGRDIRVEKSSGSGRGGGGGGYRGGSRSDACYDWRAGRCNRGSSCKFSHDEPGGGGGGGGRDYGRDDRGGRDGRDRDGRSGRDDRDDRDFGRDRDRDRYSDRRDSRDDRGGSRGGRDRSRSRERDSGGYDRDRRDRDRSRDRR